jgi:hypothetical protein
MPNELVPSFDEQLPVQSFSDLMAADDDFLSRIQLYSSKSNAVSEGKITPNHYGIPTDNEVIDLGDEVDVVILSWRAKALDTSDTDNILESFDPDSDVFKDIRDRSGTPDSGCMFGPEFLIYVPSVEKFLTFFMSSKSARREARKMEPLLRCAATLKSKIVKKGKYVWAAPVVLSCSQPLDLPSVEVIKVKINKFLNPPKKDVSLAEEDDRER